MLIEMENFAVTLMRKRVKNINLRIQRTGEVRVSAPFKMPLTVIHGFLNDKRPWIDAHLRRLQSLEQSRPQAVESGASVYFLGQGYELVMQESNVNPRMELTTTQLHFFVKPGASATSKQTLLTRWYHSQMQQHLPPLFEKWETIIGVKANAIRIKTMKTRWGSCHPIKKHISLNLRLIERPLICLEYVIVHELVHLLEASHNARFYALMERYMPQWKTVKRQLESMGI